MLALARCCIHMPASLLIPVSPPLLQRQPRQSPWPGWVTTARGDKVRAKRAVLLLLLVWKLLALSQFAGRHLGTGVNGGGEAQGSHGGGRGIPGGGADCGIGICGVEDRAALAKLHGYSAAVAALVALAARTQGLPEEVAASAWSAAAKLITTHRQPELRPAALWVPRGDTAAAATAASASAELEMEAGAVCAGWRMVQALCGLGDAWLEHHWQKLVALLQSDLTLHADILLGPGAAACTELFIGDVEGSAASAAAAADMEANLYAAVPVAWYWVTGAAVASAWLALVRAAASRSETAPSILARLLALMDPALRMLLEHPSEAGTSAASSAGGASPLPPAPGGLRTPERHRASSATAGASGGAGAGAGAGDRGRSGSLSGAIGKPFVLRGASTGSAGGGGGMGSDGAAARLCSELTHVRSSAMLAMAAAVVEGATCLKLQASLALHFRGPLLSVAVSLITSGIVSVNMRALLATKSSSTASSDSTISAVPCSVQPPGPLTPLSQVLASGAPLQCSEAGFCSLAADAVLCRGMGEVHDPNADPATRRVVAAQVTPSPRTTVVVHQCCS